MGPLRKGLTDAVLPHSKLLLDPMKQEFFTCVEITTYHQPNSTASGVSHASNLGITNSLNLNAHNIAVLYRCGIWRILCAEEIQPQKPTNATRKKYSGSGDTRAQPETLEIPIYSQGTVEAVTSGNLNAGYGRIIYTGKPFGSEEGSKRGSAH